MIANNVGQGADSASSLQDLQDLDTLEDALARVAAGGSVLDPEVVAQLLVRRRSGVSLQALSPREREVLALIAEGRSNSAIAEKLVITDGALEKHVAGIFTRLGLAPSEADHRRVLAVLAWAARRARLIVAGPCTQA